MPHPLPQTPTRVAHEGRLRVGDVERSHVCDQLSEHFGHGRLTPAELDDRLAAAMAARTMHELTVLTADLPRGSRPSVPRPGTGSRFTGIDLLCALVLVGCVLTVGALMFGALMVSAGVFVFAAFGGTGALLGGALFAHLLHRLTQVRGDAIGQRLQHSQQSAA